MDDIVELELRRAVNVTNTDYIRRFVAERVATEGRDGPAVELVHFNVIILCTEGSGSHMVDFEDYEMRPGTAIWIRPGQVQRWSDAADGFDALVAVFDSTVIPDLPLLDRLVASTTATELDGDATLLRQQMEWMASDLDANQDEATAAAVVGVILRLFARHSSNDHHRAGSARRQLADSFVQSVEEHLEQRSVAWHARRIGSSTRTIARATAETLDQRPKEIIDARVMLEAQRRLAWSTDDVGTIARSLRFSDSSNFTKFFRLRAGISPSAFRAGLRTLDPLHPG
ncbi:MAG: helix-turn-helix transcriptional regulator [Actinomycetota bacterium]